VEAQLGVSNPKAADMLGLTVLHAGDMGITDLTGLEYGINLTVLKIHDNQISDISPLSGLTNLTDMNLEINSINDISALAGLTNLEHLCINQNQVSDISVLAGLTNLKTLFLYENQISDISALSSLTNLYKLLSYGNQISNISALADLTNLTTLTLGNNQISDISVLAELTNLEWLELDNNQISDISPISGLTNFTHLDLTANPLNGDAYITYIPQILANNPGMTLLYDPQASVLLSEDFDDGDYNGWILVEQGIQGGPMVWSASTGEMVQSSNVHSPISEGISRLGTFAYWLAGSGWTDYTATVKIKSDDNDGIGIMFRYQDENNYYRFIWDKERSSRALVKCEDGQFSILDFDMVPYVMGKNYQVKISVQGNSLQVSIDGSHVLSATDSTFSSGTIALYCWGNRGSYFDDILVESIP
jgi:hypothetical protein